MEIVRYKPGEAIRWFQTEAGRLKSDAKASGRAATEPQSVDMQGISETVKNAASAVFNLGRSAYAEMAHIRANASEFVLLDDRMDIVSGTSIKAVPYSSVKKITLKGDKAQLILDKGTFTIKPFAYIVSGPLKVPIGWERNGLETPYHLIIEELAARCNKEVELA
ncbi:MAG: hypothetical protein GC165_08520 [Armatimonadetes bacterium]|nr:hypothetical protein [Armatimonadota bacterium]